MLGHRQRFHLLLPNSARLTDRYNAGSAPPVSVSEEFQRICNAIVEAACATYGELVAYDRLRAMVQQQLDSLKAFNGCHPFGWTCLEQLHQVLALRLAIHTNWCITTLEAQLRLRCSLR